MDLALTTYDHPSTRLPEGDAAAPALPTLSVDLLAASYRSDLIPADWTSAARERSLTRYRMWLALKQRHPTSALAPTRDIDLFWHVHMLAPVAYHRDCQSLFGRILDHDGGFGREPGELPRLQAVFLRTARRWEALYGVAYREDGAFVDDGATACWHDCQDRCWHACSEK